MALANFGSPARNIPPWPIFAIGIRNAQDIAEAYKQAAVQALTKGLGALDTILQSGRDHCIGQHQKGSERARAGPEGRPTEATPRARGWQTDLETRKNSNGSRVCKRKGGTKYWLVTGQLRNSITYVIGGKWWVSWMSLTSRWTPCLLIALSSARTNPRSIRWVRTL